MLIASEVMMKKAAMILIPVAFFVGWWWMIIGMIHDMSQQQASDRLHAMILGCNHRGELPGELDVMIFECRGNIELHQRVKWK
jgi:hypothetical protein